MNFRILEVWLRFLTLRLDGANINSGMLLANANATVITYTK